MFQVLSQNLTMPENLFLLQSAKFKVKWRGKEIQAQEEEGSCCCETEERFSFCEFHNFYWPILPQL
jgi:hypothetical protein